MLKTRLKVFTLPILAFVILIFLGYHFTPEIIKHIKYQRQRTKFKANVAFLNQYLPDLADLADFAVARSNFEKAQLKEYITYYERVVKFFPEMSDAYGVLGFCYYQNNEDDKAIEALKKGISLKPYLFWFHYDLGVIYFKSARYKLAAESFNRAIQIKPEVSAKIIASSKVFQQIMSGSKDKKIPFGENLQKGYLESYTLLAVCLKALAQEPAALNFLQKAAIFQKQNNLPQPTIDKIEPQVF